MARPKGKNKRTTLADAPMEPPPPPRHERKYMHVQEWRDLLEAAREAGRRSTALVLLMYEGGLRRQEPGLLRLSYAKDLHRNLIYIWRGKGSRSGNVKLSMTARQALVEWIDEIYPDRELRRKEHFVFPGRLSRGKILGISGRQVYNIFRQLCIDAQLDEEISHPHVMKHSRVQHLLEAGSEQKIDPMVLYQSIADIIGHAAAKTTIEHYAAATSKERKLVDEVTNDLVRETGEFD